MADPSKVLDELVERYNYCAAQCANPIVPLRGRQLLALVDVARAALAVVPSAMTSYQMDKAEKLGAALSKLAADHEGLPPEERSK